MKTSLVVAGAAAAVLLTAGGATATWMVMDDQEASSAGQCTGATAVLESGSLRPFELQSSDPGQTWSGTWWSTRTNNAHVPAGALLRETR